MNVKRFNEDVVGMTKNDTIAENIVSAINDIYFDNIEEWDETYYELGSEYGDNNECCDIYIIVTFIIVKPNTIKVIENFYSDFLSHVDDHSLDNEYSLVAFEEDETVQNCAIGIRFLIQCFEFEEIIDLLKQKTNIKKFNL